MNASAVTEFNKELNSQANTRDYLMAFTTKLAITTSNSIKLQASSLAQLTQATNQLTRATLVRKIRFLLKHFTYISLDKCIGEMLSIICCFTIDCNYDLI